MAGGRPSKTLDVEEIVRRHADGETITGIAESMRVHNPRIEEALRSAGVEPRKWSWGSNHPRWRGGRRVEGRNGYVRITLDRDDPYRPYTEKGEILEHRYVMMCALGRPLLATETVHHVDGDRQNNDLENLELRQGAHGQGVRFVCNSCGSHDVTPRRLGNGRN